MGTQWILRILFHTLDDQSLKQGLKFWVSLCDSIRATTGGSAPSHQTKTKADRLQHRQPGTG